MEQLVLNSWGEKIGEHFKKIETYCIFQALNFHRMSCICSKQFEMQQLFKAPKQKKASKQRFYPVTVYLFH